MAEYINKAELIWLMDETKEDRLTREVIEYHRAIDIVHCSECKHKGNEITTGQIYCGINHYPHYPDYFCADGER